MNEYRHILVAFDGSDDSKSALETAEYIAKFSDAHLTVAYVHEPSTDAFAHAITAQPGNTNYYQSPLTGDLVPTPDANLGQSDTNQQDYTPDHVISKARVQLSHIVEADYEILTGKPANEITDFAKGKDIDLIIIGNRGLNGIKEFVLGSVSKKVVDEATCPVLVVK
ncbi:universal stress protein [Virgibacillus soli]|uniref:universal stress protein n=1 Tax=Paracerasibacillus soli TaxID=480284 RepID=UPI0035E5C883